MPLHARSLHRPTCPPGSEFHCGRTRTAAWLAEAPAARRRPALRDAAGKYRQRTVLFRSCGVTNALGNVRRCPSAAGVSVYSVVGAGVKNASLSAITDD